MSRSSHSTRALASAALALGALAAFAGSPRKEINARIDVSALARTVEGEDDHVSAIELAEWIRNQRPKLRVVDVRDSASFDAFHIPPAERIPLGGLVSTRFEPDETIVLYSDGGAHAAQAWVFLRALGHRRVYFLRGGLYEWLDEVMNPALAEGASDSARQRFAAIAEISRYFGGVPRVGEQRASRPSVPVPVAKDRAGATTAVVARVRGRGC